MNNKYPSISLSPHGTITEALQCPVCEGGRIHHHTVRIYERLGEDDSDIIYTLSGHQKVYTQIKDGSDCDIIGARRNGLLLSFDCEDCTGTFDLALFQHKGFTLLKWVNLNFGEEHYKRGDSTP